MEGKGFWKSARGDTYEGQYFRNMKHGSGLYSWRNGKVFQGRFEHGRRAEGLESPKMTIEVEREITCDLGSHDDSDRFEVRLGGRSPSRKKYTIHSLGSGKERGPRDYFRGQY